MKASTRDGLFRAARALPLIFGLSLSTPVLAQDIVTAEALFESGLADMEAGRYQKGCTALAESQRLDPRTGTLFTLATCEERWGRIATAVIRFEDFILLYERLPEDRRATHAARYKVAVETRDRLKPDVPRWTLSLPPGAPVGTVVKRDGEVVPAPALGIAVPVDPGEHVVSTQAPGGPLLEKKVTVARGQTLTLTLEIAPPGTATAPSGTAAPQSSASAPRPPAGDKALPDTGPSPRRVVMYVSGGVGIAGLVAGAVLGGLVLGKKSIVDAHCGQAIGQSDPTGCDQSGAQAGNDAQGLGVGSTLGFAVGGAALAAALVVFLTEPRARSAPSPLAPKRAPTSSKQPVWVSAGPLSIGPETAVLGVRGGF